MEIKPLPEEVITKLRSTSNINNLSQCVTELVLNSLDAKSSAVAIRLNSVSFRIQVIDNGTGISQENLQKIVNKYSTNKCQSLWDLEKKTNTHGYKGESLWSISNISKVLSITSKYTKSENTFSKTISFRQHGKVILSKSRQSSGTTVTIDGIFYNLPVRQKRMKKEYEIEKIIKFLKRMSIISPQISITLRDDISGKLLFKRPKRENILQSLSDLYPEIKYDETKVMKVKKDKITVEGFLTKYLFKDKLVQYIYVNKRPVHHQKLRTFIFRELAKDKRNKSVNGLYPMIIFNIRCSQSKFSVIYENSEAKVEFVNIDLIYRCIRKLILNFLGISEPINRNSEPEINRKSICELSDLAGTVKGFGFKDWLKGDGMIKETMGLIEDNIEIGENPLEIVKPLIKSKLHVKKAKPKSLPINIYAQNQDMSTKSKVVEKDPRKSEIYDYEKDNSQKKNKFLVPVISDEHFIEKVMMDNYHSIEKNCRDIRSKKKFDDTLFSHFTNTEEKGKDLIMYMFLKSTELFHVDTFQKSVMHISEEIANKKLDSSRETIMESNIFFQNITKSKTHQLNKTISVSVRLKRSKNFKLYDEKASFSEKYSFSIPAGKKRRIQYFNEAKNVMEWKHSMSPYFKEKVVPNFLDKQIQFTLVGNLEDHSAGNLSRIEMWNSLIDDDNKRMDILCSEQFHYQNTAKSVFKSSLEKNNDCKHKNLRKYFDQISISNDRFMKRTNQEKNIFQNYNQSYLFNSESAIMTRNKFVKIDPYLNQELISKADHHTYDNFNNECYLKTFDFGNISLSPIPKKHSPKLFQNMGIYEPVFYESQRRSVSGLRKRGSESEILKIRSPYFSKENLKYEIKQINNFSSSVINNYPMQQKKMKITKGMGTFRRYHTEPLERIQYIQNMKNNIDKIFLGWKYDANVPHHYIEKKSFSCFTKKKEADIYTKDNLVRENNIQKNIQNKKHELKNVSPLWKEFIKNKHHTFKVDTHLRKNNFVSYDKIQYKVTQNNSLYFGQQVTAVSENSIAGSADLFCNVQNESHKRSLNNNSTLFCNSAASSGFGEFEFEEVYGDKGTVGTTSLNSIITLNMEEESRRKKGTEPNSDDCVRNTSSRNESTNRIDEEGNEKEEIGITSVLYPRKEDIYIVKERPEYMPKGLSPLIIPYQKLEKSLSPISKEKLHEEILKSYFDDLGRIKWEKFLKGYEPKKFFEDLYNEKVNEYEKEVPNVIKMIRPKFTWTSSHDKKFSKMIFNDLKIIGQIDQKFIAAIDKKNNLILFDQHAVHERIRLEKLLKEYHGKSSICDHVTLLMDQTDIEVLTKHKEYLNDIGIYFHCLKNAITIHEVPLCFLNKITKGYSLPKLLQLFIRELLELGRDTRGVLTGLPKIINQIINMEACRGSVKFGESLSHEEMEKLIDQLSHCTLPFQCAHGRPTLIPLLTLNDIAEKLFKKPNLKRLKMR